MDRKAGVRISRRAFLQSALILLAIMLLAGILTRALPAGEYARVLEGGREMIDPDSFRYVEQPDYPAWHWFTAPVEVLWGPDAVVIITILVFILAIGGAFAVLDYSGLLRAALGRLVAAFGGRRYALLLAVALFFMLLGALLGIFEEVVPLVPLAVALAIYLGFDSLVGLAVTVLATNLGFSAAIANPFTLGVAQGIAGLPLFSGAWLRVIFFFVVYAIFAVFLLRYARRIERKPQASLVYAEDQAARERRGQPGVAMETLVTDLPHPGRGMAWLTGFLALILVVLLSAPFVPTLGSYSLPIIGLLFLIAGVGAALAAGLALGRVFIALKDGVIGIAPGIVLILMASSIKHIITHGGVMDTILHQASRPISTASPFAAAVLVYFLALAVEFLVASGSAKAFLMMPILLPLADLVGLTRQVAVSAYCFGDGFSNMAYPTNPVLLISLGLTVVTYPRWIRWTLGLWLWVILASLAFLGLAVALGFGPF